MQEVRVMYVQNGKFAEKQIYMDPHVGQDENGNNIYNTKEYFQALALSNNGLAKGFFEQNSVNAMDTNYIGSIGQDENGRPNRSIDHAFLRKYKQIVEAEREQKRLETENRRTAQEDEFKAGLKDGVHSGYQSMCDNMDRNYIQKQSQSIHNEGR